MTSSLVWPPSTSQGPPSVYNEILGPPCRPGLDELLYDTSCDPSYRFSCTFSGVLTLPERRTGRTGLQVERTVAQDRPSLRERVVQEHVTDHRSQVSRRPVIEAGQTSHTADTEQTKPAAAEMTQHTTAQRQMTSMEERNARWMSL